MKIIARSLDSEKTKIRYKKVAWFYDFWGQLTESTALDRALKEADISDGQKVLELACGTGALLADIVKRNPHGENVGVDLSPDMLEKAAVRLDKTHAQNYKLLQGDVFKLEFPDQSFDVIINTFMIDLMPEEQFDFIANEFFRLIKPDGIAVVTIFSFGEKFVNQFWGWLARVAPALLTGCRPVSFRQNLVRAGFVIEAEIPISQNTFPSQVIKARRPK